MKRTPSKIFDSSSNPIDLRPRRASRFNVVPSSTELPGKPSQHSSSNGEAVPVPISVIQFANSKTKVKSANNRPPKRQSETASPVLMNTSHSDDDVRTSSQSPTSSVGHELVPWSPPPFNSSIMAESELIQREYFQNYMKTMRTFTNWTNGRNPFVAYPEQRVSNQNVLRAPRPMISLPALPWPEAPESEWTPVKINFVDPYGYTSQSMNDRKVYFYQ